MFFYNNIERLQLFLSSPNECAALLNYVIIVEIYIFLLLCKKKYNNWLANIGVLVTGLSIPITMYALVSTFSRGGIFTLVLALFFLAWLIRQRAIMALLPILFMILCVIPHGAKRVGSIAYSNHDASIVHRLLIWEGSCGIICEHPWRGVGINNVGAYYTAWHQPLELHERYSTAVSDLFTLGAAWGVPFLVFYYGTIAFLFWYFITLRKADWQDTHENLYYLMTIIYIYVISSLFSSFFHSYYLTVPAGCSLCLLIILAFKHHIWHTKYIRYALFLTFFSVVILISLILLIGNVHNNNLGFTRYELHNLRCGKSLFVQKKGNKNLLLFIGYNPDSSYIYDEKMLTIIRTQLRYSIANGFNSVYTNLENLPQTLDWIFNENKFTSSIFSPPETIVLLPDKLSTVELLTKMPEFNHKCKIITTFYAPSANAFYDFSAIGKNRIIIFLSTSQSSIEKEQFTMLNTAYPDVIIKSIEINRYCDGRIKALREIGVD